MTLTMLDVVDGGGVMEEEVCGRVEDTGGTEETVFRRKRGSVGGPLLAGAAVCGGFVADEWRARTLSRGRKINKLASMYKAVLSAFT